jgi:hypothetical protein
MYTYFLTARQPELAEMRTENDVLAHIEEGSPQLGGFYTRERIDYLSTVFCGLQRESSRIEYELSNGSSFYEVQPELVRSIANAAHDALLDASVAWDEGAWQDTDVNRMDLAGFLIEFAQMCKTAIAAGRKVYFVFVEE